MFGSGDDNSYFQFDLYLSDSPAGFAGGSEKASEILMEVDVWKRISDSFVRNGLVSRENQGIYTYGIRQLFVILVNVLTTVAIGFCFQMLWECLLFMVAFVPLRRYAGGYHARTQLRCSVSSVVMIIAALMGISYLMDKSVPALILAGLAIAAIWRLAPIGDANKPLDDVERLVYRRRTGMVLGAEIGLLVISLSIGMHTVSVCIVCGLVAVAVLVVVLEKGRNY